LVNVYYGSVDVTYAVKVSAMGTQARDMHHVSFVPKPGEYMVALVEDSQGAFASSGAFWSDCDGVPYTLMQNSWEVYCSADMPDWRHMRGGGEGWERPPFKAADIFAQMTNGHFRGVSNVRYCAFRTVPLKPGDVDPTKCRDAGGDCRSSGEAACEAGWHPVDAGDGTFSCISPEWPRARTSEPLVRKGSFFVVGDWGWDAVGHYNLYSRACQQEIADKMDLKFKELGDVHFVVNVGDSFYPDGVKSKEDSQWQVKWRDVYSERVRSVPWYSVYGNHDYHIDQCACGEDAECAQVNYDPTDRKFFYMPGPNYHVEHPELDLEVVGLDLNKYMTPGGPTCCGYTECEKACKENLNKRGTEAMELFWKRFNESQAKTMVVFSHYPTDYFRGESDFIKGLSDNSRRHIAYFGGHRHNTDNTSTISTHPNDNWVVGGGGGFSCEGGIQQQGFVVGEIDLNDRLSLYPVLVDNEFCCRGHGGVWNA